MLLKCHINSPHEPDHTKLTRKSLHNPAFSYSYSLNNPHPHCRSCIYVYKSTNNENKSLIKGQPFTGLFQTAANSAESVSTFRLPWFAQSGHTQTNAYLKPDIVKLQTVMSCNSQKIPFFLEKSAQINWKFATKKSDRSARRRPYKANQIFIDSRAAIGQLEETWITCVTWHCRDRHDRGWSLFCLYWFFTDPFTFFNTPG